MSPDHVLFARVGWMKLYKGPQAGDEKPIGGGAYTKTAVGNELFNFLRIDGRVFGYFQPMMKSPAIRKRHPSAITLQRIEPGFQGDKLKNALVVFVARDPKRGGQLIVGWYKKATVYRYKQKSTEKARDYLGYFVETAAGNETLVPEPMRSQRIPSGAGGFGRPNICYVRDPKGKLKPNARWVKSALDYILDYEREDAANQPASESDPEIAEIVENTIERAAGFQSNPRIRRAIEEYAMNLAAKRLRQLGFKPVDTHKTKSYDFTCMTDGEDLHVEVKGTQESGRVISLTPNEVKHARRYKNCALFIVHTLKVKGKRNPTVSEGIEMFLPKWDISSGKLVY